MLLTFTLPHRLALASISLGIALFATPGQAQTVVTDPVGFVNTVINGTNGAASSALTFVGLSTTQPIAFQSTVGSYNGATKMLTPTSGSFTADQFNGANGAHFVEITSGVDAGRLSDITATSTSSITTADDLSASLAGGESLKIRKHWTLQSVFGPNPSTSNQVILGTGSASSADEVLLFDAATQQYITYYYKVGGIFGGDGWRSTTGPNPLATDVSTTALPITDGMIIRRKLVSAVTLTLPGSVKLGATQRDVLPGLNLAGDVYPAGATLGNSGLYDAAHPESSLQGGSASTADQVLIYDGAQYTTYYYKIGGIFGGDGWRSTTGPNPLGTDASTTPLPAGQAIIVKRLANVAFVWTSPQPFVVGP